MKTAVRLIVALVVVLGFAGTSRAQTATGQITGVVSDSTGAVMAKVKVTVSNQGTGLQRETLTNDQGTFTVPLLPVGIYLVTAEQTGFKLAMQSDVQLNVDQVQRVNLELSAGNVSERVDVKADAATIDTDTSTIGQVISEKQVTDLPLNGRNFIQLLFLGAGAVMTDGEQGACARGSAARSASWGRGRRRTTSCSTAPRTSTPRSARWPPSFPLMPFRSSRNRRRRTRPSTGSAPTRSTSSASPARTASTDRRSTSSATRNWTRGTSSTR